MKKINKKGFTLVELLAVITILAILFLIAVPGVRTLINRTRRSGFESSIKMAVDSVENMASFGEGSTGKCFVNIDTIAKEVTRGSLANIKGYVVYDFSSHKAKAYSYHTANRYVMSGGEESKTVESGNFVNTTKDARATTGGIPIEYTDIFTATNDCATVTATPKTINASSTLPAISGNLFTVRYTAKSGGSCAAGSYDVGNGNKFVFESESVANKTPIKECTWYSE